MSIALCNAYRMSTSTEGLHIPAWDLADRLRKALREADLSVQEMADYLDVSRNTVSAWINGRTPPGVQSVRLWALRTGVPYEWLRTGASDDDPHGGPGDDPTGQPPAAGKWSCCDSQVDSNPTNKLIPFPGRDATAA